MVWNSEGARVRLQFLQTWSACKSLLFLATAAGAEKVERALLLRWSEIWLCTIQPSTPGLRLGGDSANLVRLQIFAVSCNWSWSWKSAVLRAALNCWCLTVVREEWRCWFEPNLRCSCVGTADTELRVIGMELCSALCSNQYQCFSHIDVLYWTISNQKCSTALSLTIISLIHVWECQCSDRVGILKDIITCAVIHLDTLPEHLELQNYHSRSIFSHLQKDTSANCITLFSHKSDSAQL